jgi:hypothetical protein
MASLLVLISPIWAVRKRPEADTPNLEQASIGRLPSLKYERNALAVPVLAIHCVEKWRRYPFLPPESVPAMTGVSIVWRRDGPLLHSLLAPYFPLCEIHSEILPLCRQWVLVQAMSMNHGGGVLLAIECRAGEQHSQRSLEI